MTTSTVSADNGKILSWYLSQQKEICLKLINAVVDDIGRKTELLQKLCDEGVKQQRKDTTQRHIDELQERLTLYLKKLQALDSNLGALSITTVQPLIPRKGEFRQGVYISGTDDGDDICL